MADVTTTELEALRKVVDAARAEPTDVLYSPALRRFGRVVTPLLVTELLDHIDALEGELRAQAERQEVAHG